MKKHRYLSEALLVLGVGLAALILAARLSHGAGKAPPKPVVIVEPSPTIRSGLHFAPIINYTDAEKTVLAVAEKLANGVVQSGCFSDYMVTRKLIQTDGRTPAQVVMHLKTAKLTVPVHMYDDGKNGVIGYHNPGDPTIYTNRPYVSGASACARASNLSHESSHVLGYSHDFQRTARRDWSVPYSINFAFMQCCVCSGVIDCVVKP